MGMGGFASFNVHDMIAGVGAYQTQAQQYLAEMKSSGSSGQVSVTLMMAMQFSMQMLSTYTSTCSSTLTALNNELKTMANAIKGQ